MKIMDLVQATGSYSSTPTDAEWENVVLLLNQVSSDAQQNQSFDDESTSNHTITANGNVTQGTFSPFSPNGFSTYFNGATSNFTFTADAGQSFSGAFTIECWLSPASVALDGGIHPNILYWENGADQLYVNATSGYVAWYDGSSDILKSANSSIVAGNRYHVAVVRDGSNNFSLFVDSVRVATTTDSNTYGASTGTVYLGAFTSNNGTFHGLIHGLRVVNGTAVYDPTASTLTVPTTKLTAIANTELLTCQSNRFIDESSNVHTLTVSGTPKVIPTSPFGAAIAWSAASHGGSAYFDGSGDYLTAADSSDFSPSGDFTIASWFYTGNITSQQEIVGKWAGGNYEYSLFFISGGVQFYWAPFNTGSPLLSGGTLKANSWVFVAVTRTGNTFNLYVNETRVATTTSATSLTNGTDSLGVGALSSGATPITGFMGSTIFINGTALYTGATLTVPTAPFADQTNTVLLLNFTNAGIYDAAAKNVLYTEANTQTDTGQSTISTASILLDGTGDRGPIYGLLNTHPIGAADFTIEFFYRPNTISGTEFLIDFRPLATDGLYPGIYLNSGVLTYYVNSGNRITGSTLSTSTWYHIAISRSSGTTKMFLDGTQDGSSYTDTNVYLAGGNGRPVLGDSSYHSAGSYPADGNFDQVRITVGAARYTTTFTSPTTAFPLLGG